MKYKLFISAAGRGTRIGGLTAINKSLLPINYEAVISKIIESYPKNLEIVIALGHEKEIVKNYDARARDDRKLPTEFNIDLSQNCEELISKLKQQTAY